MSTQVLIFIVKQWSK